MANPTEINQSTLAIDGTAAQLELNLAAKGKDPLFRYRDPTVSMFTWHDVRAHHLTQHNQLEDGD